MTIRHWLMYAVRPAGSDPVVTTDAAKAEEYRGYGWRVEGPFVPEDAGAVQAVREQAGRAHYERDTPRGRMPWESLHPNSREGWIRLALGEGQ
jgi:hypothetical protein